VLPHHALPAIRYQNRFPIGKRYRNTRVDILDQDMNPVTAGEIGELYAGGDGLARGYLNACEPNYSKFC